MLEIMIIDDDIQIRERLKSMIAWEELSVHLSCEAGDSEMAMELYLLKRPKLIITDVNIPLISGLDLAERMQKEDPELQFIVITGYQDMEMAQKALELRAITLLIKPISASTINDSLKKAIARIEEEREKEKAFLDMEQLISENRSQMQEIFMMNLMRRQQENDERILQEMARLELPAVGDSFAAVVLKTRNLEKVNERSDNSEVRILRARKLLAKELEQIGCRMFAYVDFRYQLNCVVISEGRRLADILEGCLEKINERLQEIYSFSVFAGIGSTTHEPTGIHKSYLEAVTALRFQSFQSKEGITHYKNLEKMASGVQDFESVQSFLRARFRSNDLQSLSVAVQSRTAFLMEERNSEAKLREFFFAYIAVVITEALAMGIKMEQIERFGDMIMKLFQKTDPKLYAEELVAMTEKLLRQVFSKYASNSNHLMELAKEYIDDNLDNKDIDLQMVSDHVGLSRSYFCKLFRQVEGINFNSYLKDRRIQKAQKLLLTTNMKIFEISDAVGISNAKYFSYVFRQTVGLTPLEYQSRSWEGTKKE